MKKVLSLIIAAAMLAICLVSCGGKSVGVKVIDIDLTAEEYAYGVDKAQPELLEKVNAFIDKIMSDGTFDKICNNYFGDGTPNPVTSATLDESKDQLVVATNAGFEPFEYTDGDKYVGIDMEIADLLAKELGVELVINNMDFDAVCLSVGQHKCDIAMAGLTVKPDREEYVTFSKSYYNASQKLIVKADDTTFDACKTKEDVEAILSAMDSSKKIGVQNGTTGQASPDSLSPAPAIRTVRSLFRISSTATLTMWSLTPRRRLQSPRRSISSPDRPKENCAIPLF